MFPFVPEDQAFQAMLFHLQCAEGWAQDGPSEIACWLPTLCNTFVDWNHSLEGCSLNMYLLNANWISIDNINNNGHNNASGKISDIKTFPVYKDVSRFPFDSHSRP